MVNRTHFAITHFFENVKRQPSITIVSQETEVSIVPVLIEDERVEYEHAAELFSKVRPERVIVVQTVLDVVNMRNVVDGNKRDI